MKAFSLIFAAVLYLSAGLVGAQDLSEEDIFSAGAFDQSVEAGKQSEQKDKLEYLVGGVFLASTAVTAPIQFDRYAALGGFSGKAFVRLSVPSYGSLYFGVNFQQDLFQAAGPSSVALSPGTDLFETKFDLAEFYLSFDVAKAVFFRIGNQLIAWGPSVIWTPVDFFNLEKANPQASVDLRAGKPALRIHAPLGKSNLFLVTDFAETIGGGQALDLADTVRQAVRFDFTALGYELGLSTYFGAALPARFGLDLSGRLFTLDVYAEAALTVDFPAETAEYAFSLGFQRSFGELKDWTISGEMFYNSAGQPNESAYPDPLAGQFTPLYLGQWYVYAGLTKQNLFADFLNATLSGFLNASDFSYTSKLALTFDLPRVIPFTFSLGYSGGGANKEFTAFSGDNALNASLQFRFEF